MSNVSEVIKADVRLPQKEITYYQLVGQYSDSGDWFASGQLHHAEVGAIDEAKNWSQWVNVRIISFALPLKVTSST